MCWCRAAPPPSLTLASAASRPTSATQALTAEGEPNVTMGARAASASSSGATSLTPRCAQGTGHAASTRQHGDTLEENRHAQPPSHHAAQGTGQAASTRQHGDTLEENRHAQPPSHHAAQGTGQAASTRQHGDTLEENRHAQPPSRHAVHGTQGAGAWQRAPEKGQAPPPWCRAAGPGLCKHAPVAPAAQRTATQRSRPAWPGRSAPLTPTVL